MGDREAVDCRLPDGGHDSAVPRQLAQHVDHCDLDSALDPDVRHRAQRPARNDQHHDARRTGACGRHPGGRRDGDNRKHRTQSAKKERSFSEAILDGAAQIAVPAFVSTLCICIVFLPMFFLTGVARYLFVPLAEAVVFAMLASYRAFANARANARDVSAEGARAQRAKPAEPVRAFSARI